MTTPMIKRLNIEEALCLYSTYFLLCKFNEVSSWKAINEENAEDELLSFHNMYYNYNDNW